jgi:two-component system, LuxR family, response regulator FixJ
VSDFSFVQGAFVDPNDLRQIYVVDDDVGLCQSIAELLEVEGYQVRSWNSAVDFLNDIPWKLPAVLVTDMRMPSMSGVELQTELSRRGWQMPIIYISGESTVPETILAMKQGVFDFLIKPFRRDELLRAVFAASERSIELFREQQKLKSIQEQKGNFSPRELQVYELLRRGFGNQEIMNALKISLPTAKQYKAEVMRKLSVRSLAELMALEAK